MAAQEAQQQRLLETVLGGVEALLSEQVGGLAAALQTQAAALSAKNDALVEENRAIRAKVEAASGGLAAHAATSTAALGEEAEAWGAANDEVAAAIDAIAEQNEGLAGQNGDAQAAARGLAMGLCAQLDGATAAPMGDW